MPSKEWRANSTAHIKVRILNAIISALQDKKIGSIIAKAVRRNYRLPQSVRETAYRNRDPSQGDRVTYNMARLAEPGEVHLHVNLK